MTMFNAINTTSHTAVYTLVAFTPHTIGIVRQTNSSLFGPNTALSAQIFANASQPFPGAVEDVKTGVRYLRNNAARLGLAPERAFL